MRILIFLLVFLVSYNIQAQAYKQRTLNIHTTEVLEIALFIAPYVTLIDDDAALKKAGAILAANTVSMASMLATYPDASGFAISAFTSAGILCTMQSKGECAAGLLAASTIGLLRIKAGRTTWKGLGYGVGLGLASGMLVPGLFVTF